METVVRMDITSLDRTDATARDELFRLADTAAAHDRPGFPTLCRRLFEHDLTTRSDEVDRQVLVGRQDDRAVGAVFVNRSLVEDRATLNCAIVVDPALRRRGIGRQLFDATVVLAREHGRTALVGSVSAPLDESTGWTDSTGFGDMVGGQRLLTNIQRRLDLADIDVEREDHLYAEASAAAHDYRLVHWTDAAPEKYIADLARLEGRINADVPHGDAEVEVKQVDTARMRRWEDERVAAGMTMLTLAVQPRDGGRLAGYTQLRVLRNHQGFAGLPITLVDPDHRGHRLGLLLKIAARRLLAREQPRIRAVVTNNAADNAPILAINDRLGYRRVGRTVQYRYDVP